MGLFSNKKINMQDDKIWETAELKFQGIANETMAYLNDGYFVIIVYHFKNTLEKLKKVFNLKNL